MPRVIENMTLTDAEATAWVFGAGASVPYDVPVQARLLQRFANMEPPGGVAFRERLDVLREKVASHCRSVQPGLAMTDGELSLEEVFAAHELVVGNRRASVDQRHAAEEAIVDLREAVRRATYVYGRGDALKWRPHERDGAESPYAELIEKLFPLNGWEKAVGRHVLITFNYDINLDRCLIRLRNHVDVDLDYGVTVSNDRCHDRGAPDFAAPRPDRAVLLLRTHGSLNWVRCWACHALFATLDRHADVREDAECWACGRSRLDYVLVHPSYLRTYDDPIIQLVWGRCQEELCRANRWVFIGYSLPPADVHFRELLRDCLQERERRGLNTEIVLVGRGPMNDANFAALSRVYETLFTTRLVVWNATERGFAGFVRVIR